MTADAGVAVVLRLLETLNTMLVGVGRWTPDAAPTGAMITLMSTAGWSVSFRAMCPRPESTQPSPAWTTTVDRRLCFGFEQSVTTGMRHHRRLAQPARP